MGRLNVCVKCGKTKTMNGQEMDNFLSLSFLICILHFAVTTLTFRVCFAEPLSSPQ